MGTEWIDKKFVDVTTSVMKISRGSKADKIKVVEKMDSFRIELKNKISCSEDDKNYKELEEKISSLTEKNTELQKNYEYATGQNMQLVKHLQTMSDKRPTQMQSSPTPAAKRKFEQVESK